MSTTATSIGRRISAIQWVVYVALGLAVLGAGEFHCDDSDDSESVDSAGRDLFAIHCAACHGSEARGDGPLASTLEVAPADLTRLGERYGLPLPEAELEEFVDGRHTGISDREMPVFGEKFYEGMPPDTSREYAKRVAIGLLVDYLESIQAPADR